ncbi:50S ribosomal protein L6 [Algivirga pacifica]|uniref:Large ribosomal subunit protein uL6 n=1 Tax=Algivirga pacifica TaxID=1162670 RepID=A0ABP9DHD9_9BACT
MSRIGKKPITLPSGVEVKFNEGVVSVKGPKGELSQEMKGGIELEVNEGEVALTRPNESKESKAMHGLYRALIQNMVVGVTEGYKKSLELVGVGFKATNQGNLLNLDLGYSHSIIFQIPAELSVSTESPKGAAPIVHIEGIDKQLVGQVAAKLKSLRKTEPYKGKGVKFVGEVIRRKAGKTGK